MKPTTESGVEEEETVETKQPTKNVVTGKDKTITINTHYNIAKKFA